MYTRIISPLTIKCKKLIEQDRIRQLNNAVRKRNDTIVVERQKY